jgi:hypothetical protein
VHLQLGPWRDRDRVTHRPAPARRPAWTRTALACAAALTACSPQPAPPRLAIDWAAPPAVGVESVANLRLLDASDRPVPRAALRVNAFMSHPGMAPVEAAVEEQGDGHYRVRLHFTMAGDWVVRVQGATTDGRSIDVQDAVHGVRPAQ